MVAKMDSGVPSGSYGAITVSSLPSPLSGPGAGSGEEVASLLALGSGTTSDSVEDSSPGLVGSGPGFVVGPGFGPGFGVGVTLGVGLTVGVGLGVGFTVGETVGFGVGETVGETVGDTVGETVTGAG